MKLTIFLLIFNLSQICATVFSQNNQFDLNLENITLKQLFKSVEEETPFKFVYRDADIANTKVSVNVKGAGIDEFMTQVLASTGITYRKIENNLIIILPVMWQNRMVTGKVTDASTSEPVPGVNVYIEGTTRGTITNANGEYSIEIPDPDAVLIFSFVGYISQRIKVGDQTVINMSLSVDFTQIDELVVIGYGTQRKSDITGTVASIPQERLEMVPNLNIAQAIQGAVSGVMIRAAGGGAEPDQTILVRGRNSIKANNDPLIIVDGIPYGGSLNDINPHDVASIEILKDASAAAIYGSRGSNGVIIISSKEGAIGKPVFAYDGKYGINDVVKTHRLLNGPEFYEFKMTRNAAAMTQSEEQIYLDGTWTDWTKLATRNGQNQEHNLSVSGGFKETRYYVGLGYTEIKGIAINDDFSRLSTRINVESQIFDWLAVGTRTNLSFDDASGAPANFDLVRTNPLTRAYDEFGRLTVHPWPENIVLGNHLAPLLYDDLNKSYQVLSNNYAVVDFPFIKGLSYRLNTGMRTRFTDLAQYRGRNTTSGYQANGRASISNSVSNSTVIENILAYNREFGKHTIFGTALYSYEGSKSKSNSLTASNFPNDFFSWYAAGQASVVTPSTSYNETNLISQMLRLNYAYDSRYLVTLTGRRDGYSGFGENTKWGTFPSFALGWNLANEDFFPLKDLFRVLKLRASIGLNGNQAIGAYESISRLSLANIAAGTETQIGYKPSKLGLDNLGWESSRTLNLGVDFGILEGRISGDINYYQTNTFDILLDRTISAVHGLTSITQNIGETQNNGLEVIIQSRNLVGTNFKWSTTGNLAFNKNKILSLYGFMDEDGNEIGDVANAWFIGQPINVHYDFVWEGTWQLDEAEEAAKYGSQPGFVKLKDFDGDGLTADDRRIIGQEDPKLLWGLTNTFSYRNFTLNIFIHGVHGATMVNYLMSDDVQGAEVRYGTIKKNWWTPDNPTNDWIMNKDLAQNMGGFRGNVYEKNDYVRIKDVSLSYDLPANLTNKAGIGKLRVYLTGRNMFTFTKSTFLDPEFTTTSQMRSIPLQKEYVVGLNISF